MFLQQQNVRCLVELSLVIWGEIFYFFFEISLKRKKEMIVANINDKSTFLWPTLALMPTVVLKLFIYVWKKS